MRMLLRTLLSTAALMLMTGAVYSANDLPFKITVDGETVDGSYTGSTSKAEVKSALSPADIQVKFDGLGVRPVLNVATVPPKTAFKRGETVRFLASFNYAAWIDRAEILIFEPGRRGEATATLDVSSLGAAEWVMPEDGPGQLEYVLRVYDTQGRFDETVPLPLSATETVVDSDTGGRVRQAVAPGYGEDRTAVRNIDIHGGAITVFGRNVPPDHDVTVLGEPVPVDADGTFAVQRVLPPGAHSVDISILKNGVGLEFAREVAIPETEWFAVGLADFTAGYRLHKEIEAVRPGEFDDIYTKGRLAFYLKGKIKGRYILTAAADTGEQKLKNIFKGLDEKDPRTFLRRLDPDDYYPVYGDDSTVYEDAPTRGKFYVRLERGPSSIMWGNFKSNITGTKFLRSERALYGAQAVYRSEGVTSQGEVRTAVDAYAAQPGTVPQRDVLRGTGGSAYFLKHQDITPGSETITLERRNSITNFVIERKTLTSGRDYTLDHVQGVLLLQQPLPSSSGAGTENFVVAQYEFTPAAGDVEGYSYGGRAQQWLGDHVRVGVTGMREKTEGANQTMYGADVRLQATPETYVEAEVARSEGPGFGKTYSPDGGLTTFDNPSSGQRDKAANGYRVEGRVALEDVTRGKVRGMVKARYEHYEAGFTTLDTDAKEKKTAWGVESDVELTERVKVTATYSEAQTGSDQTDREGQAKARIDLNDHVSVEPYARVTEYKRPAASKKDAGERTIAGSRLIYRWDDENEAYVFAHATVSHSGRLKKDNRVGVGGKKQITDRIAVSGEVSEGTQGIAAEALINYEPSADGRYYLGYKLEADRDEASSWPFELLGTDLGTIVVGAQQRLNEQWELFAEENYDMFGERRSWTQVYGVNYSPLEEWTIGGGLEVGTVYDNTINPSTGLKNPDFDRKAFSLAVTYHDGDAVDGKIKGEARFEDSDDDSRDLRAYLLSAALSVKASDDWRALGSLDAVFTDATDAIKEGQYAEGSVGFAYRPAEGDRFNMLAKYTFLYDNPGRDQVTIDGTKDGPSQRSHIFSVDASYDVIPQLTLGAKYGFRLGEVKERTPGARWEDSDVHLGILRADLHLVHEWDAMVEGRILWSPTTEQTDYALLVALYRQVSDNLKVGVGYNFGQFSDDLRDLTFDDGGVFINVVGKI